MRVPARTGGIVEASSHAETPHSRKHGARASKKRIALDLSTLTASVPASEERIKEGKLDKLCVGSEWQERRVILTSTGLYLSHWGSDLVLDHIPLHEITKATLSEKKTVAASAIATIGTDMFRRPENGSTAPASNPHGASLLEASALRSVPEAGKAEPGNQLISDKGSVPKAPLSRSHESNGTLDDGCLGVVEPRTVGPSTLAPLASSTSQAPSLAGGNKWEIHTIDSGYNSGRSYFFRAASDEECREWVSLLKTHSKLAYRRWKNLSLLQTYQEWASKTYDSLYMKIFITLIIIANFLSSTIEAQIRPEPDSNLDDRFFRLDIFFTVMFTLELFFNAFGNWFYKFWSLGWNWLDVFIVVISLASFTFNGGEIVKSIRIIRAMRVLRLVRQLESLRHLVNSILASIIPVMNAFLVVLMVQSIYAVGGVQWFGDEHPIYFGAFDKALFTLSQVSSFDSWSSLARSMFEDEGTLHYGVTAYFISYMMIVGYVLLSVVIAILIDNFSVAARKEEQRIKELDVTEISPAHPLDPLLDGLMSFDDDSDLSTRIEKIFKAMDVDDSGDLSFDELRDGLKKLVTEPQIHLSHEDFVLITQNGEFCDEHGSITRVNFDLLLRDQLKAYVHRQLATEIQIEGHSHGAGLLCSVLKQMYLTMDNGQQPGYRVQQRKISEGSNPDLERVTSYRSESNTTLVTPKGFSTSPRRKSPGVGSLVSTNGYLDQQPGLAGLSFRNSRRFQRERGSTPMAACGTQQDSDGSQENLGTAAQSVQSMPNLRSGSSLSYGPASPEKAQSAFQPFHLILSKLDTMSQAIETLAAGQETLHADVARLKLDFDGVRRASRENSTGVYYAEIPLTVQPPLIAPVRPAPTPHGEVPGLQYSPSTTDKGDLDSVSGIESTTSSVLVPNTKDSTVWAQLAYVTEAPPPRQPEFRNYPAQGAGSSDQLETTSSSPDDDHPSIWARRAEVLSSSDGSSRRRSQMERVFHLDINSKP